MPPITTLAPHTDDHGNVIAYDGDPLDGRPNISVDFADGENNRVVVAAGAKVRMLRIKFTGNDGLVEIGPTVRKRTGLRFKLRVGHGSTVRIGPDVGCTGPVFLSATEGQDVIVGEDVMFAQGIEVRADDAHAIYDVTTGLRTNPAQSIRIGNHVWLAKFAVVLGGVTINDGAVIGFRSLVTRSVPNNCIAAGAPARVVRRNIAWERPVTTPIPPGEGLRPRHRTKAYWNLTDDGEHTVPAIVPRSRRLVGDAQHLAYRAVRRARRELRQRFGDASALSRGSRRTPDRR